MVVAWPECEWPDELQERGPPEDPTILLTGTARIGDIEAQVVAIRIDATLQWEPDFRRGIADERYQVNGLGETMARVLEGLESVASDCGDLLGGGESNVVTLASGPYRMWIIPGPRVSFTNRS